MNNVFKLSDYRKPVLSVVPTTEETVVEQLKQAAFAPRTSALGVVEGLDALRRYELPENKQRTWKRSELTFIRERVAFLKQNAVTQAIVLYARLKLTLIDKQIESVVE